MIQFIFQQQQQQQQSVIGEIVKTLIDYLESLSFSTV